MSQLAISGFNPAFGMQAPNANASYGQLAPRYNTTRLQSEPLFSGGFSLNNVDSDTIKYIQQFLNPQTLSFILNHSLTRSLAKKAGVEDKLEQFKAQLSSHEEMLRAASEASPDEIRQRVVPSGVIDHLKRVNTKDPIVTKAIAASLIAALGLVGIELSPEIAFILAIVLLSKPVLEALVKGGKAAKDGFVDTWTGTGKAVKEHHFFKAYLRAQLWLPLTIKKAVEHLKAKPEQPPEQVEAPADAPPSES